MGNVRREWGSIIPKWKKGRDPKKHRPDYYFVAYTGPDGRRHTAGRSFPNKGLAEGWLAEEKKLEDLGTWTPPADRRADQRAASMTVGDLITAHETHLAEHGGVRESTLQSYRRTTTARIFDATGAAGKLRTVPLAHLNREHAADWWRAIGKQYPDTETTNRRAYVRLRAAAAWGVRAPAIPLTQNPVEVDEAKGKPEPKLKKKLPTSAELRAIIDHLPARYRALGVLTLFHGLRVGEALGLTRSDVTIDGSAAVVHVRGNVQRIRSSSGRYEMRWQETKTAAGVRMVPIFPEFVDVLRSHRDQFTGPKKSDWFTATESGAAVFDTSFRSVFGRARTAAGVRSDLTPHHGRNYLITLLAERGATPKEIGELLGQEDIGTIIGVYMKTRDARKRGLMQSAEFEGES